MEHNTPQGDSNKAQTKGEITSWVVCISGCRVKHLWFGYISLYILLSADLILAFCHAKSEDICMVYVMG